MAFHHLELDAALDSPNDSDGPHWQQRDELLRLVELRDRRCQVTVRVPWFNQARQLDEWGFHCMGCRQLKDRSQSEEFIMSTFKEHLEEAGPEHKSTYKLLDEIRGLVRMFRIGAER
jgi:hypothetical protein